MAIALLHLVNADQTKAKEPVGNDEVPVEETYGDEIVTTAQIHVNGNDASFDEIVIASEVSENHVEGEDRFYDAEEIPEAFAEEDNEIVVATRDTAEETEEEKYTTRNQIYYDDPKEHYRRIREASQRFLMSTGKVGKVCPLKFAENVDNVPAEEVTVDDDSDDLGGDTVLRMLNKEGTDAGYQAMMKSEQFRRNAMAFYRQPKPKYQAMMKSEQFRRNAMAFYR